MRKDPTNQSDPKNTLLKMLEQKPDVSVGFTEDGSTNIVYGKLENTEMSSGENILVITLERDEFSEALVPSIVCLFGDNNSMARLKIKKEKDISVIRSYRTFSFGKELIKELHPDEEEAILRLAQSGLEIIKQYNSLSITDKEEISEQYSYRIREERNQVKDHSGIDKTEVLLTAVNRCLGEE